MNWDEVEEVYEEEGMSWFDVYTEEDDVYVGSIECKFSLMEGLYIKKFDPDLGFKDLKIEDIYDLKFTRY